MTGEKPNQFKACEIGYFRIDIAELRHEGGKAFLYVAVDRTSKLVFARIYRRATKMVAAGFEPPRVCRRLQLLRRWSLYEQDDEQIWA